MGNNRQIAEDVLAAVGGKDNVTRVTHCMTRLRLNLKDQSLADKDRITAVNGVLGVVKTGGQYQIVIGNNVDDVYKEVCDIGQFKAEAAIEENLDTPKEKFTLKKLGGNILDYLAGSITPLIPALMVAVIFKMATAVLGDMLGWIPTTSDLYKLFTFVGDASFYFVPVLLGYTSAKKLGANPMVGAVLGAILIHPTLVGMATAGTAFKVFGISTMPQAYNSTILPILLSSVVLAYVEKFFKKILPQALKIVFVPGLTILVMLPITLLLLGPAGAFIGKYLGTGLFSLGSIGGVLQILMIAVVAALWEFFVMTGMHMVFIVFLITNFTATGSESFVTPGALAASFAVSGMALGAALRLKDKEERSLAYSYLVAGLIGGITEPGLYGLGVKYRRPFLGMMIGAAVAGIYGGIMHVTAYAIVPVASFIALTGCIGGNPANFINAIILAVIAIAVSAVATYFWGFKKNEPAVKALKNKA